MAATRLVLVVTVTVVVSLLAFSSDAVADDDICSFNNNPQNRPDGSLIQTQQGGIYLIETPGGLCYKRPFLFGEDFATHRYAGWISVATASDEELNKVVTGQRVGAREGSVLQAPNGQLFVIDEISAGTYQKRYIQWSGWVAYFQSCSYGATAAGQAAIDSYPAGPDVTNMTARPDGQVVKPSASSSTVYLITQGQKKQQFYNSQDRSSYNFAYGPCVDALIGSPDYYPFGYPSTIRAREGTAVQDGVHIYIVDQDTTISRLRWVTSMESLNFFGRAPDVHSWTTAGYSTGASVHPYKSLFADRWDQPITDPLRWDKWAVPAPWDSAVTNAIGSWESTSTPINFSLQTPGFSNDIHVIVQQFSGQQSTWGGYTEHRCPCSGGVYHSAWIFLNSAYSSSQPLVAHELGHALTLAHDGLNADQNGDGLEDEDLACGMSSTPYRVPTTIMDYDCYKYFGLTSPANWDVCGFNHAYPTGWGSSGC